MKWNLLKIFKKNSYGIIISVAVFGLVAIARSVALFDTIEDAAYDLRFNFRGESISDAPLLVIEIDDKSLQEMGRWPWPRDTHSGLLRILQEYGAEAVFFDILFIERDGMDPYGDLLFSNTVKELGNVFIPYYFSATSECVEPEPEPLLEKYGILNEEFGLIWNAGAVVLPFRDMFESAAGTGFANGSPDADGIYRRAFLFVRYLNRIYPGIALAMAARHLGADLEEADIKPGRFVTLYPEDSSPIKIPVNEAAQMLINYRGCPNSYKRMSYYGILELYRDASDSLSTADFLREKIEGRTIFVGMTATGSTDIAPTPFDLAYPMVFAQATIFDNIVNSDFIYYQSRESELFILLALALILGIVLPRMSPFYGALTAILMILLYGVANIAVFKYLNADYFMFYPMLGIVKTEMILFAYKYATEEKEKKRIRGVFSTYMTPSVVNQILLNPDLLKLGGERREMTVFFSDLSGFTGISESLEPEDLVGLINQYLEAMTRIIFKYEGTLDKYEGDAIMAFWNAPLEQRDHAVRATLAALECFKELERLQQVWRKASIPELDMRIGINTGQMIVGNMGSVTRMDYTVMGDSVNLGSRLESANKFYGTRIMISEFTNEFVKDLILTRELDALKVKGKTKPIRVYEALGRKEEVPENIHRLVKVYAKALFNYRMRKWEDAEELFRKALSIKPGDGPSDTYIKRCIIYRKNPPPSSWKGVWELDSK